MLAFEARMETEKMTKSLTERGYSRELAEEATSIYTSLRGGEVAEPPEVVSASEPWVFPQAELAELPRDPVKSEASVDSEAENSKAWDVYTTRYSTVGDLEMAA